MRAKAAESEAAKFNLLVMRKLQKALSNDPEIDLASQIPKTYSARLGNRKATDKVRPTDNPVHRSRHLEFPEDDLRNKLLGLDSAHVIFPISDTIESLISTDSPDLPLAERLVGLVKRSSVIWKPQIGRNKIVLRCNSSVALKIIRDMDDTTDYTILQYLEKYNPDIPAPKPLGLVTLGVRYSLIFMTLMPGTTLASVWNSLDHSLKQSVQQQLEGIFTSLRTCTRRDSAMPLGGVAGEGCKDMRRNVRIAQKPIWTVEEFDDWQFSNPHFGSSICIEGLRKLSPTLPPEVVLSHNDLRPDNIIVELRDGRCYVTGIIDWQYSGFYPTYFESTKVMNSITPNESNDWYSYIPECISPVQNAQKFLLDSLWGKFIE